MPEIIIRRGGRKKPEKEKLKTDSGKIRAFISSGFWARNRWYIFGVLFAVLVVSLILIFK